MSTVYLFQIDSAPNNDTFFNGQLPGSAFFYRGSMFRVGEAPWIPDGLRVEVEESRLVLTLIELEDTKANALISSRKYLAEDSNLIVQALSEYLGRVISDCRSTGDPRKIGFAQLQDTLAQGDAFVVKTACALRSSQEIIEELPLIDQPHVSRAQSGPVEQNAAINEDKLPVFEGSLKINAEKTKALGRCVAVLDAVVRHKDHSDATFHSWRMKSPLKRFLRESNGSPVLRNLILGTGFQTGMTLDFEALLSELVALWSNSAEALQREDARRIIRGYFLTASRIRSKDRTEKVFDDARRIRLESGGAAPR